MEFFSFTEALRFEKNARKLIDDDSLSDLQLFLCEYPDHGKIIQGSGGVRKLRWKGEGRGKRGGLRAIYYVATDRFRILLLDIYAKSEKDDLAYSELIDLKRAVEQWLSE